MKPFISVLLPTRGRPERCNEAIQSLYHTADDTDNFEILLRNDWDDPSLNHYQEIVGRGKNIYRMIGQRKQGYWSVPEFYNELSEWSNKPWIMFWNDDVLMEGRGWDRISDVPLQGFICQQETHRLGGSTYHRNENAPMMMVPRNSWKLCGEDKIPNPTDYGLHELLCKKNGWKVHWLEGCGIWHQRDNDQQLEEHRKL